MTLTEGRRVCRRQTKAGLVNAPSVKNCTRPNELPHVPPLASQIRFSAVFRYKLRTTAQKNSRRFHRPQLVPPLNPEPRPLASRSFPTDRMCGGIPPVPHHLLRSPRLHPGFPSDPELLHSVDTSLLGPRTYQPDDIIRAAFLAAAVYPFPTYSTHGLRLEFCVASGLRGIRDLAGGLVGCAGARHGLWIYSSGSLQIASHSCSIQSRTCSTPSAKGMVGRQPNVVRALVVSRR